MEEQEKRRGEGGESTNETRSPQRDFQQYQYRQLLEKPMYEVHQEVKKWRTNNETRSEKFSNFRVEEMTNKPPIYDK